LKLAPGVSKPDTASSTGRSTLDALGGADFRIDFTNGELPDPKLNRFHEIWLSKCQGGRLPGRGDFDPTELPPEFLPWITIFDVEEERFRVRIVGTGIVAALEFDATGRYTDELPNTKALEARARWAVGNAKPYFMTDLPIPWDQEHYTRYSVICLPLANDGIDVDKLLYMMTFDH